MNAREIERLAAEEAAARRAKSKPGAAAMPELQHLMQRVQDQCASHHTPAPTPKPAQPQVKPGTPAEIIRLCEDLRSRQETRKVEQGVFGNRFGYIHVLL